MEGEVCFFTSESQTCKRKGLSLCPAWGSCETGLRERRAKELNCVRAIKLGLIGGPLLRMFETLHSCNLLYQGVLYKYTECVLFYLNGGFFKMCCVMIKSQGRVSKNNLVLPIVRQKAHSMNALLYGVAPPSIPPNKTALNKIRIKCFHKAFLDK